ncbi:MAG: hypothetical protein AAB434_13015 [Planctomycetota bacterium]
MSELTTPPDPPNVPAPPPNPTPGSTPAPPPHEAPHSVIIRQYPKVIFLYPVFLFSIAAWAMEGFVDKFQNSATLGAIFFCIFAINMLVISFEFTRTSSVAILLLIIALVFAFLYFDIFPWLKNLLGKVDIRMNAHFYGSIAWLFGIIYAIVFANVRFDYYEIKHNEILRHHGYLGDVERYPAPNLKMQKEIRDILEFVLLRSGRLVLQPATESRAIVMENIIGINRVEARIQSLLGRLAVSVEKE